MTLPTPDTLRLWISQFGVMAPFLYVALYAANTVTLLPPIGILSLSAGLAFGPAIGFLAIMAGAMIGTSLTFLLGRRLGRGFVERRLKGRFKSLDEALERNGFATVLFFRIVPIVPYEVLNYGSGLSKIPFRDYGLATFLGLIPGAAVAAFFGDSLTQPFSPKFIAAIAAMAMMIAIPTLYLRVRRKTGHGTD
ncbi:MAG: TVP38/TMEM64 family protein [Candidatus Omnitrophica bacterium]|nr:TVP38/TMEM64 family protein [Candidatus Omnitrophota bacterium]